MRVKDTADVPMVLVGNKVDLGSCQNSIRSFQMYSNLIEIFGLPEDERVVSKDQGQHLARQFNCAFMEASAKLKVNVPEVSAITSV